MSTSRMAAWVGSLLVALAGCTGPSGSSSWWADGRSYMVAADHEAASQAGAEILARGGNAVDAAVATSFALAVVRPESCGLGGGGFLLLHRPGSEPVVLDFREVAPAGATLDNYRDKDGKPIADKTAHGPWAVGVPGQVKGMMLALERYGSGKLSRREVLAPAIRLARQGLRVDDHLHEHMRSLQEACRKHPDYTERFAELRRGFLQQDGEPVPVGGTIDRGDLAATIQSIAEHGEDVFYQGGLGEQIVAEIQRRGGPMTMKDLNRYTVRTLVPLRGRFGPYDVISMPPPSSGGAVILQVLNVLSAGRGTLADASVRDGAGAHVLVEAMKHGFADRAAHLGDRSDTVMQDVARMISPAHGAAVRSRIDPDRTKATDQYGRKAVRADGGTSHFCVVDARGWALACTETINLGFGSYVVVAGTGIILNNEMDDFAVDTETPNAFGLRQSRRNLIRPGRRPLSSMSPTIVLGDGQAVLLAGASGGPKIITATLQTLLNVLADGMSVDAAVAAPRLHHQWLPDELLVQRGMDPDWVAELRARGHRVTTGVKSLGHVQAIGRTTAGWRGASDPDKGGKPAGE